MNETNKFPLPMLSRYRMKRLLLATLSAAACIQAAQPTQADLQAALENAKQQWGIEAENVTISLAPASGCGIYNAARRKNKKDQDAEPKDLAEVVAYTSHRRHAGTTTTTITFAAGDIDNGEEPVKLSDDKSLTQTFVGPTSSYWTNVIQINAACNWDDREFLRRVVVHEYGHALGMSRHSRDDHDIMYWLVYTTALQSLLWR